MDMLKKFTPALAALLVVACALPALASDPSPAQVYQAARGGNLAAAQQMIAQVLRDQPQSGQAHYVAAEIDARAGNYGLARQELQTAESLEPGLPFANARSVQELQAQLGEAAPAPLAVLAPRTVRAGRSHLGLFMILVAGAVVLWLVLRRRAAAMGYPQYPGSTRARRLECRRWATAPAGYMPGGGSGIMGSVASGLALGAGVAAGEELVDHMLGGGSSPGGGGFVPPAESAPAPDPNADMGGNDFGLDDPGSWDGGGGSDGGGGGRTLRDRIGQPDRGRHGWRCAYTTGITGHARKGGRTTVADERRKRLLDQILGHRAALQKYLRKFTAGAEDVEDLVQEAYVRVCAMPPAQVVDSPRALLFSIARNLAVDRARQKALPRHR